MNNQRVNYFTGQYLDDMDFKTNSGYLVEMFKEHNKSMHTWGIASGLNVTFEPASLRLNISPGSAIDSLGQLIRVEAPGTQYTITETQLNNWTQLYLTIAYDSWESFPDHESGKTGFKRITEEPKFALETNDPPSNQDTKLVLAQVFFDHTKSPPVIHGLDFSLRTYAGVSLGVLQNNSAKFILDNVAPADWAELVGTIGPNGNQLTLNKADLKIENNLIHTGLLGIGKEPAVTMDVEGNMNIDDNVTVEGAFTCNHAVTKNATVTNNTTTVDLFVDNAGNFNDIVVATEATLQGDLTVQGLTTVTGDLLVQGGSTFFNSGTLSIQDNFLRINNDPARSTPLNIDVSLKFYQGDDYDTRELTWVEQDQEWYVGTNAARSAIYTVERLNSNLVGMICAFASNTIPAGWLICNGNNVDADANPQYMNLFNVIGRQYGNGGGDGSTDHKFTLPDLQGHHIRGWDASQQITQQILGKDVIIKVDHAHTYSANLRGGGAHQHKKLSNGYLYGTTDGGHSHTVGSNYTGGVVNKDYINNRSETALHYCIKY